MALFVRVSCPCLRCCPDPLTHHHHTLHRADDDEPALSKRKLISLWSMLVKNMELHKYQIQQVLYQQRAQLAQQGTEVPDEHIGTYS